jgi:mRNA interferase RelE/StbE
MIYELDFADSALKEWNKLDSNTREQFRKKLKERCIHPRVPAAQLRGSKDRFKIKLRKSGYRLVYQVQDRQLVVFVIAVGRRDSVYETLDKHP